jgi:acetylornithine/succinyldiaminopimelate/putrescine aminotransferase
LISVERGDNDTLYDNTGRAYIDLFSSAGSVYLGHANAVINNRIKSQLDLIANCNTKSSALECETRKKLSEFLPESLELLSLYSTGMEACEMAMHVARFSTGRMPVIGFERSMHGKSLSCSKLSWSTMDEISVPAIIRLQFSPLATEDSILQNLSDKLRKSPVGAIIIEPFQGVGGGYSLTNATYNEIYRLCKENGALVIFDEILTGFYRTSTPFYFSRLDFIPDVVIVGKGIGNGFPVSGLLCKKELLPFNSAFNLGTTFSNNPLAMSAVCASLAFMQDIEIEKKIAGIEKTLDYYFHGNSNIVRRSQGAMCVLEFDSIDAAATVETKAINNGIYLNRSNNLVRLLPAATILMKNLEKSCEFILDAAP